eukprot:3054599-Rhodomonas_salina.1
MLGRVGQVPLVISLGLGLGKALGASDGFGILSLASVCPVSAWFNACVAVLLECTDPVFLDRPGLGCSVSERVVVLQIVSVLAVGLICQKKAPSEIEGAEMGTLISTPKGASSKAARGGDEDIRDDWDA